VVDNAAVAVRCDAEVTIACIQGREQVLISGYSSLLVESIQTSAVVHACNFGTMACRVRVVKAAERFEECASLHVPPALVKEGPIPIGFVARQRDPTFVRDDLLGSPAVDACLDESGRRRVGAAERCEEGGAVGANPIIAAKHECAVDWHASSIRPSCSSVRPVDDSRPNTL